MITSTANPQIKNLIQLQKKNRLRQEQGIFIIEGIKMYREAPTDQIIKTYVSESFYKKHQKEDIWKGESLEIVTDRVFEAASDTKTPQGVLSLVKRFEYDLDDIIQGSTPLIMVLENIQDPGNLGENKSVTAFFKNSFYKMRISCIIKNKAYNSMKSEESRKKMYEGLVHRKKSLKIHFRFHSGV